MKRWMIYLLLVAGAFLFPKRPVELGKLIPVELILVEQEEGAYLVRTETGDVGRGITLPSAIQWITIALSASRVIVSSFSSTTTFVKRGRAVPSGASYLWPEPPFAISSALLVTSASRVA